MSLKSPLFFQFSMRILLGILNDKIELGRGELKIHTGLILKQWNDCSIYFFCHEILSRFLKELSLCHKLWFSIPHISGTLYRGHKIFQTMNPVRLNIQSLKYQTLTLSECKDIWLQKLMFVAKTQFLCKKFTFKMCSEYWNEWS